MEVKEQLLEFDWDLGNKGKNFIKHNVTEEEAEEIFFGDTLVEVEDEKHSENEKRTMILGKTNTQRLLSLIITYRKNKIRIISARDMSQKERKLFKNYEQS